MYLCILLFVITGLNSSIDCEDNVTYMALKWPFDYQPYKNPNEMNSDRIELPASTNLPSLLGLYDNYKNNPIQIDDDSKYDRDNNSNESQTISNSSTIVNKSESELLPTVDPIVPIIKRMLRRKDVNRKEHSNTEFKRRKGYGSSSYTDDAIRSTANKVYNDDDENHSTYSDADEEDDDAYYEDDNYAKKSLGGHSTGWSPSPLNALPLQDHYYTGSTGIPSYWNSHGHYYPYYHAYPSHHYGMAKYGKHFHREEYAIILVVISLAAFLGLIFLSFMPYALIQSQALTGIVGNSVPYTNAVTTLNAGGQFSNAAVSSDVNRIPINVFGQGRRRRKRMIRYNVNRYLNDQIEIKSGEFENMIRRLRKQDRSFERLVDDLIVPNLYRDLLNSRFVEFAVQSTINLINNL